MFVSGKPRIWLRVEGLVLFVATIIAFSNQHQRWWLFPALLLLPDIFMIGYLANSKFGALLYNVGHSYPFPAFLTYFGWRSNSYLTAAIGIIWLGHIGWDRFFGYGLKYDTRFKDTHLGSLGK